MQKIISGFWLLLLTTTGFWTAQLQPVTADSSNHPELLCQVPSTGLAPIPHGQECVRSVTQRSLTVVGQGQVTAPADTALLEFRLGSRESLGPSESRTPGVSLQTAQQATEETLKPIIKALTDIQVPARDITTQLTNSLQSPKLLVRLEKPTQERVQQVVLTVDRSLQANRNLFLQGIGAGYAVNNCQPLERSVRRIALQDARRQLTALSQELNVQLGELLFVTAYPLTGSASSVSCGSKVGVPAGVLSEAIDETTPPYNPADKPEVQVRSQVSVTHAIKTSN